MTNRLLPVFLAFYWVAQLSFAANETPEAEVPEFSPKQTFFFEKEVLPILSEHCFKCHSDKKQRSMFRLDARNLLIAGGEYGPAASPENWPESRLLKMISYSDEEHQMPPRGKLPAKDIETLTRWIHMQAPYTADRMNIHWEPEIEVDTTIVNEETKNFWAFRPVQNPIPPEVNNPEWNQHSIDRFIYARLAEKNLSPAKRASREVLIRRATYDLLGLAPSPDEVAAFVSDPASDDQAWASLLDRLLDSPHYGIKWGRHWLDLVRYADTNGYERDSYKPKVWQYRDYVIDSFNHDKPYPQFLIEQLAGDELPDARAEHYIATAYYRLGVWDDEPADRLLQRYDVLDGIVDTTGRVMLGLTLGCARCHSHKIDPIPQADYYSFLAYFHGIRDMNNKGELIAVMSDADIAEAERQKEEFSRQRGELENEMRRIEQEFIQAASGQGQASDLREVRYRFFRDTYQKLPDFDRLRHENEGKIKSRYLDPRVATRHDFIGFVYEAKLVVETAGKYSFELDSTDGSRLRIGGNVVIDYDGRHEFGIPGTGAVELSAGTHDLRLDTFKQTGPNLLLLRWKGPGFKEPRFLSHPDASLPDYFIKSGREGGDLWRVSMEPPRFKHWQRKESDDSSWKQAKGGFGAKGTPSINIQTPWKTKQIFLRKDIHFPTVPESLQLEIFHDEDVTIYLNGNRILQRQGFTRNYQTINLRLPKNPTWPITPGRNVLAVECRQTSGGQGIDLALRPSGLSIGGNVESDLLARGNQLIGKTRADRYRTLRKELTEMKKQKAPEPGQKVFAVAEGGIRPPPTFILKRGNPQVKGAQVEPSLPSVLDVSNPEIPVPAPGAKTSGRRLALAQWIASPDNKLTWRVAVNRAWQYHFGRGIVRSTSDFGYQGERPTHPLLLDHLASEFKRTGGSWKKLHKYIMTSQAYRMNSTCNPVADKIDPANDLMWRFEMRRLTAEEIRDSIISVTGQLNPKMGGPNIYSLLPAEVLATSSTGKGKWGDSPEEERNRRSIYVTVRRSLLDPNLTTFDQADTDNTCEKRFVSTVPAQALLLLNSDFTNRKSRLFAKRLQKEATGLNAQIRRGMELTFAREIDESEVDRMVAAAKDLMQLESVSEENVLERVCLILLNLNEFLFLD